jgi:hypothetical protein
MRAGEVGSNLRLKDTRRGGSDYGFSVPFTFLSCPQPRQEVITAGWVARHWLEMEWPISIYC